MFSCSCSSLLFCWLPVATVLSLLLLKYLRSRREYLGGVDSVFVTGDPYGVIVVHAVVSTKTPLSRANLRKVVSDHYASHRRFRQRIVRRVWRWHYYQDVEKFDIDQHVRVHKLPALPANATAVDRQTQFEEWISKLSRTPLDMTKPPWEFLLVEQYGQGSCFVMRVHHAIADGITLMRISMNAFGEGTPVEVTSPGNNLRSPSPPSEGGDVAGRLASSAPESGFKAVQKYKKPRTKGPRGPLAKAQSVVVQGVKTLAMPCDPVSMWKPATNLTLETPMNARWLRESLSLAELKQVCIAQQTAELTNVGELRSHVRAVCFQPSGILCHGHQCERCPVFHRDRCHASLLHPS
jgi:hypothetical protein